MEEVVQLNWYKYELQDATTTLAEEARQCFDVLSRYRESLGNLHAQLSSTNQPELKKQLTQEYHMLFGQYTSEETRYFALSRSLHLHRESVQLADLEVKNSLSCVPGTVQEGTFLSTLEQIYSSMRALASATLFFEPNGPTPVFTVWEHAQQRHAEEVKGYIQHQSQKLVAEVNGLVAQESDPVRVESLVEHLKGKFERCIVRFTAHNLERLAQGLHGRVREIFAVTLSLNSTNQLTCSPSTGDIIDVVSSLCDQVVNISKSLVDTQTRFPTPKQPSEDEYSETLAAAMSDAQVQQSMYRIAAGCRTLQDRLSNWLRQLEVEFKPLWAEDWLDSSKYLNYLNRLKLGWKCVVRMNLVTVDSTELQQHLTRGLTRQFELWKQNGSQPVGGDSTQSSESEEVILERPLPTTNRKAFSSQVEPHLEPQSAVQQNIRAQSSPRESGVPTPDLKYDGERKDDNDPIADTLYPNPDEERKDPGEAAPSTSSPLAVSTSAPSRGPYRVGSGANAARPPSPVAKLDATLVKAVSPTPTGVPDARVAPPREQCNSTTELSSVQNTTHEPAISSLPLSTHPAAPLLSTHPDIANHSSPTPTSTSDSSARISKPTSPVPPTPTSSSPTPPSPAQSPTKPTSPAPTPPSPTPMSPPTIPKPTSPAPPPVPIPNPSPTLPKSPDSDSTTNRTLPMSTSPTPLTSTHPTSASTSPLPTATSPTPPLPPVPISPSPTPPTPPHPASKSPSPPPPTCPAPPSPGSLSPDSGSSPPSSNSTASQPSPTVGVSPKSPFTPPFKTFSPLPRSPYTTRPNSTSPRAPKGTGNSRPFHTLPSPVNHGVTVDGPRSMSVTSLASGGSSAPGSLRSSSGSPIVMDGSLHQVYRFHCHQNGIKPNSGLLKILPKEPGVSITEINMDYNYIGVKGIQPLLEILKLCNSLRILNLKDNNLENNEIKALVQVLQETAEGVRTLDLSNNPISLAGGSALLELVNKKRTLTEVRLSGTLIQPKVLSKIQEVVASNRALQEQQHEGMKG